MEFRRIDALPPYAFAQINALKMQLRRAGEDVIDLGFGNPDLPSPDVAVEKLIEAVRNPRNHRYSLSNGIPKLREALAHLYQRKFDVTLDFETEVCSTIGAKEGFSHLMLTLVGPGDTALVPSPSYPDPHRGPIFAGAAIHYVRLGPEQDFFANLHSAWEQAWPPPRVWSPPFPHPTRPPYASPRLHPGSSVWWWPFSSSCPSLPSRFPSPPSCRSPVRKDVAVKLCHAHRSRFLDGRLAHGLPRRQPPVVAISG